MYTKIYWIHDFANGAKLGIMPRPRGDDWLEEEIVKLKKQNTGLWVSLLEQDEMNELGLRNQPALCSKHDLEYINFPIVDRHVPDKGTKIDSLIEQLYQKIQNGNSVVIHCRMGIGRSSIIAACVLLKQGFKTEQILQKITSARGLKVPDTDDQIQWLKNREKTISK
ncbi:MAG TPA: dual specificity protein phosphatase family protein [Niastella sp.]